MLSFWALKKCCGRSKLPALLVLCSGEIGLRFCTCCMAQCRSHADAQPTVTYTGSRRQRRRLYKLSMASRTEGRTRMTLLTLASVGLEEEYSSKVNMTSPNKTRLTLGSESRYSRMICKFRKVGFLPTQMQLKPRPQRIQKRHLLSPF
jgi:hypothetical protein